MLLEHETDDLEYATLVQDLRRCHRRELVLFAGAYAFMRQPSLFTGAMS